MKKSLTLLLAMAMVFSMFATVAFADTSATTSTTSTDIQTKVQVLESAGVLNGFTDGTMRLNDNMTRAQFAKVAALILGLKVPTTVSVPSYTDTGSNWASKYIEAATSAGLLNGVGMGKFDPNGDVTTEQMAKVLDLGLKLDTSSTAAVNGTVSNWAKSFVAAAVKAGLIPQSTDYTTAALRSQLVSAGYAAYEQVKGNGVTVTSSTAVDANTVSVTFSDGVTKQITLTTPLQLGVAANVPVTYNGVSYTVTVTLQQLSIVKAAATAPDTVTVTFNQGVADTANAKAALSNMGESLTTTATWSDDKTQLMLKAASNLLTGQYTVTIDGLNIPDGQNTSTFMVTAAQVSKIVIDDTAYIQNMWEDADENTAAPVRSVAQVVDLKLGYKLLDQYGNDITSNYANLNVSSSSGIVNGYVSGGTINLKQTDANYDTIVVSMVDTDNGVSAVQNVQIKDKQQLAGITLSAPQPFSGDTAIKSGDTNYVIPAKAVDQYGNSYSFSGPMNYTTDDDSASLSKLVTFVSSDTSVLSASDIGVDANGNLVIQQFETGFSGNKTVTLKSIVNATGQESTTTFTVQGEAAPNQPILVAPSSRMSVDNTSANPYKVQLNVNDVFGSAMSAKDIVSDYDQGKITLQSTNTSLVAVPSENAVVSDGTNAYIELYYNGSDDATGSSVLYVYAGTNSAHMTITVTDSKYAQALTLVVDNPESVYKDNAASSGQIKLTGTFKDQYGNTVDSDEASKIALGNQKVYLYTNTSNADSDFAITAGEANGGTITSASPLPIPTKAPNISGTEVTPAADSSVVYVTVAELLSGDLRIAPTQDVSRATTVNLAGKLVYLPSTTATAFGTASATVSLTTIASASNLTFVADPGTVTVATYGGGNLDSPYAVTLGIDGKDTNGNTVALPSGTVKVTAMSNDNVAIGQNTGGDYVVVGQTGGSDGAQETVAVQVLAPGATPTVVTVPVTVKSATPVAQTIVAENSDNDTITSLSIDASSGYSTDFFAKGQLLHFLVTDQYGTNALDNATSVYVDGNYVTPSGSADDPTDPYTFTTNGQHTITAINGGQQTSITVFVSGIPEA